MRALGPILVALLAFGCGSKGKADLTVTGSPTGKIDGQLRVVLAFSKPMVAKDKIGQPVKSYPLTISPSIDGEAKWSDDKTLVVVPLKSLPVSTKFTATVAESTKALDKGHLAKDYTFEFFTERLAGTMEVVGAKERATKDQIVKLVFTQEVPFEQLTKQCSFDSAKQHVGVKLAPDSSSGPAKAFTIIPAGELAMDTDWTVTCKKDLRGSVGNLGLEDNLEEKFHTYGPLRFVKLDPSGTDVVPDEDQPLKIAFTNPLKPPYQMTLSPTVQGFPNTCHGLGEPAGLSCSVLLEANTTYTLTIDTKQKDVFGQSLDKKQELSFHTTDAKPTISVDSGYFVAELKRPVVPMWTRNVTELDVTALEITQANFHQLSPHLEWWESKPADLSKTALKPLQKKVAIQSPKNKWSQQSIDPAALFGKQPGPGMYYVEIGSKEVDKSPYNDGGREKVLVNFTDIGVVSKLSGTRGLVWATQLSTGKPLPGATVTVRDGTGKQTFSGVTDADGALTLPGTGKLARAVGEDEHATDLRIYVQKDADWTMINPNRSGGLSPWSFNVSYDSDRAPAKLRGFMHTDRGLYRPGDKVHVKGLARITKLGEPLQAPPAGQKVKVEIDGPQGKVFTETEAKLSAFGGFWFDVDLPADARLGDYVIRAKLEYGTFTREFSVEEYRAATFEVTGKAKETSLVRKGDVHATISANYLYGAPVRSGSVDVAVHSRKRHVSFPQYAGFEFGDERDYDYYYSEGSEDAQAMVSEDHVALDASGNANLAVSIGPNDVFSDADLLIRASVTAPSNEVISKTFTIPYFHARTYYGIKAPGYFLDVKKPQKFQIIAASTDGKLVAASAKVTITRRDWNCVWEDWGYRGSYQCKDTTQTIVKKTLALLPGKPADIEFTPDSGGSYTILVEGENEKAEAAPASMYAYAWGDDSGSWRSSDTPTFDIAADKKEYKAGDTATLLLQTDLAQATGLVTIERDGVVEKRLIQITPKDKHIAIPITANYAPNIYVSVALVQGRTGDGPRGKPRMRMGLINLPVRPEDSTLKVTVETDRKDYRPGDNVTASVKVTDASGKPVAAEVSITAADEGVLSLIGYETPNPVPTFYAPWGIGVTTATQLEYIRDIPAPNVERPATGGDAPGTIRSRFVSTAVWTPGALTNADGVATVQFKAPDNLTAFRLMAVAADKATRFGSADKRFTVSKPLQLHEALPRFLSLGDQLQGGVVVHNETGKPGTATVKLVVDPHVTVKGGAERTVHVAKDARVPVLFDLAAAVTGDAALRFSVTMNGESDAVEFKLPVKHPSPIRTLQVAHGVTKTDAKIPVALPADAIPESVELVVSVDPDGLAGVEDGLRDLIGYPYGCLEQTTSKMIPMIAVRELAETLAIDGLAGKQLDGFVKAGITKIGRHQTAYGGFSLWPGGEPEAYYTAYGLWGLYVAKQAGYPVDASRIAEGLDYLRGDGKSPDVSRPYFSEAGNLGAQAFALYVRSVLKDKAAAAEATTLLGNAKLPVYGKAFIARALAATLGKKDPTVVKLVGELAALAAAAGAKDALIDESDKHLEYYMSSSLRTTSAVVSALVELDAKNAAIKPLVQAIMKARRMTDYLDTQENLYSLLALTSYARSLSGTAPSVTVTLGDKQLIAGTLGGKQHMRVATVPRGTGEVLIAPKGEIYYNVELRYRRKLDALKAQANGLKLVHEYLDENGKPKTTFKVGDVVVVRLSTELSDEQAHLVVSDALPAGFEALNTRFETVGTVGVKQTDEWGTYREMHDDRVDFVSEWSSRGSYTHEFTIRAMAAGTFARPPTTAQLMYEPKVNAQTALEMIEIKAK